MKNKDKSKSRGDRDFSRKRKKFHRKTKLRTTMMSSAIIKEIADTETVIAQHFIRMHGVLQNLENKLIDRLHKPLDTLKSNLTDIQEQIYSLEDQLGNAVMMANYTTENFGRVVLRDMVKILTNISNVPCHLASNLEAEKITLNIDTTMLLTLMENHCTLEVPQVPYYYCLLPTEALPVNYNVEPLVENLTIANLFNNSTSSLSKIVQLTKSIMPPKAILQVAKLAEKPQESDENRYEIELLHVNNPSVFYVRKAAFKQDLMELKHKISEYVKSSAAEQPTNLKRSDMCIVKQKNAEYERGRVSNIIHDGNSQAYNIFFIDQGCYDRVELSRIWSITEDFLKLPPQAICCCLYDIVPTKGLWSNKSVKDFKTMLRKTNNPIFLSVIKRTTNFLYVDLCITSSKNTSMGPQSICSSLILMKHAHSGIMKVMNDATNDAVGYNREDIKLNTYITVCFSHVQSPDEIYVTKLGQKKARHFNMLEELNKYYNKNPSANTIHVFTKGLQCAAKYSNSWQRCEIVQILEKNKVEIFYVDIGCTSFLDCSELREIPIKFTELKAQAIRISLMYINPESDDHWKPEATDTLKNIFNEASCITVLARKKVKNGFYKGLISINGFKDVSRLLKLKNVVQHWSNVSLVKKTIPPSILDKQEADVSQKESSSDESLCSNNSVQEDEAAKDLFKMEVYIKRVITPDCIYVAQKDREMLYAQLMSEMQKFYENYYSEPRDNWETNAICAVYSAKDKSYLRAQIQKITSPQNVLVYLCDMGINETVRMADIQALHGKFNIPMYCFKVKLAGLLPCGDSSTWPTLSCSVLADIVLENLHYKFYITKLAEVEDTDIIPVELWIKQIKIPGPLEPSKTEMISVNRMLVEQGVALPIKNYYQKILNNAVTAAELQQQLEDRQCFMANFDINVLWLSKGICGVQDISDPTDNNELSKKHLQLTDWLPSIEITEEVFYAIPTYVDNKCIVYLHSIKENAKSIQYIETKLQKIFQSCEIKISKDWKKGDMCIAQYHVNKKWYRGRVVAVLSNILQVQFVDYGNVEDCEIEYVTKDIKLEHIPIQCTKCVISGLNPATASGKWMLHDLDRIHVLLVDRKCKVCVLQRQPNHFVVSITLLPQKYDLLAYLVNYMSDGDMNIQIGPKQWNTSNTTEQKGNFQLSSNDSDFFNDQMIVTEISQKSSLNTENIKPYEDLISGNSIATPKNIAEYDVSKAMSETTSSINLLNLDKVLVCSTPNKSQSGDYNEYQPLSIPPNVKYIELILSASKNTTTVYAQLAENNDTTMFSSVLRDYYQQFMNLMSDIQDYACSQPLLTCYEKNTPCIAKFTDDLWYRCVIINSEKLPDNQFISVTLNYIDYGNNEYKKLNLYASDLHIPKAEWLELPSMTIECKFWGIHLASNSNIDLLTQKLEKLYNQTVVARVKEIRKNNFLIAEIYKDKECQQLLYAHLIEEGFYQHTKLKEE